jgi:hypothetical protein
LSHINTTQYYLNSLRQVNSHPSNQKLNNTNDTYTSTKLPY